MRYHLLNLERSPERLAAFRNDNPACAYFTRTQAIDGKEVERKILADKHLMNPGLDYTDGAIGCALSHMAIWTEVINSQEPATVAEDDAVMRADFRSEQERLLAAAPPDWDLILWGFNTDAYVTFDLMPGVSRFTGHLYHADIMGNLSSFKETKYKSELFPLVRAHGTICYSISPRGAERLLSHVVPLRPMDVFYPGLNRNKINTGIDDMMASVYDGMKTYVCVPPIVVSKHDLPNSTVQTADSPVAHKGVVKANAALHSAGECRLSRNMFLLSQENVGQDFALETHRLWRYVNSDGRVEAGRLSLLPDGRIGGSLALSTHKWTMSGVDLLIHDACNKTVSRFHSSSHGEYVSGEGGATLIPVRDPAAPASVLPVQKTAHQARRNLVIVRAGRESHHLDWARDIELSDRTWDLCVSFYGPDDAFSEIGECDFSILQNKDRKWPAIAALFGEQSPFWQYDYVMMPDDDIAMTWSDINRCFEVMKDYGLYLAQPALASDSPRNHFSHPLTLHHQGTVLRYTSFVEVMVPIFSRDAIRLCLPSFVTSDSGWGLDWAWQSMLGYPKRRSAIIDEVVVRHMRPVGGNYQGLTPQEDEARVLDMFGGKKILVNYGVVLAQ
ncbi:DUF707 domain-containing protein [Gluconacetobacter azotocaptans]|uniref:DUF707 domain-containing protein n=1 Tax=Gluconacetobacter azotocaptans TaxID=142834 RepID=A0A7W4JW02_9PROT|nr:glycosyltransferase family 25 protein [Gluconacetobacter azotocaptans]MBB2191929.1 DUF707 domain-containing protein [Gluconacetobacter azotocaptans]